MPDSVTIPLRPDPMHEAVARVEQEQRRVVLTRDGAEVAAIIPIDDLRALEELDALEDAHWAKVAAEAMAEWEAAGRPPGVPHEEILARYGIDPNEP